MNEFAENFSEQYQIEHTRTGGVNGAAGKIFVFKLIAHHAILALDAHAEVAPLHYALSVEIEPQLTYNPDRSS